MEKTISFGHVVVGGLEYEMSATLALRPGEYGRPEFSAVGAIFRNGTLVNAGGNSFDMMYRHLWKLPLFQKVYRLWRLYHNNGMRAGTEEQCQAVKLYRKLKPEAEHTDIICHLKSLGLYEVEHDGKSFIYGSGWLYEEINEDDLQEILSLINPLLHIRVQSAINK